MSTSPVEQHWSLSVGRRTMNTKGATSKTTPAGAATPHGRGLAESKGHDRLMHSVEPTSDRPLEPTWRLGMSRVDGCPECVLNVEMPVTCDLIFEGYRNTYIFTDCDFAWTTEWAAL